MQTSKDTIETIDKIYGCLYGQAIGDALGLGAEFLDKEEVLRLYPSGLNHYGQIIQDNHRCRWAKGAWTDDTDMMLCVMRGFDYEGFNTQKVAQNFKNWFNGNPLGIGGHTFKVLCMRDYTERPEDCSRLWWEVSRRESAANGALMRTSVVGLAKRQVREQAEKICKLTHYDSRCIGSCVIVSGIIHNLVWHDKMLTYDEICAIGESYDSRIKEWIELAYNSSDISMLDLDEEPSIGYTLLGLAAALWCYWHTTSFEEGLLKIVNEGGDADTNAAIACSILGAKYGYSSIPKHYVENLYNREPFHRDVSVFATHLLNGCIN